MPVFLNSQSPFEFYFRVVNTTSSHYTLVLPGGNKPTGIPLSRRYVCQFQVNQAFDEADVPDDMERVQFPHTTTLQKPAWNASTILTAAKELDSSVTEVHDLEDMRQTPVQLISAVVLSEEGKSVGFLFLPISYQSVNYQDQDEVRHDLHRAYIPYTKTADFLKSLQDWKGPGWDLKTEFPAFAGLTPLEVTFKVEDNDTIYMYILLAEEEETSQSYLSPFLSALDTTHSTSVKPSVGMDVHTFLQQSQYEGLAHAQLVANHMADVAVSKATTPVWEAGFLASFDISTAQRRYYPLSDDILTALGNDVNAEYESDLEPVFCPQFYSDPRVQVNLTWVMIIGITLAAFILICLAEWLLRQRRRSASLRGGYESGSTDTTQHVGTTSFTSILSL